MKNYKYVAKKLRIYDKNGDLRKDFDIDIPDLDVEDDFKRISNTPYIRDYYERLEYTLEYPNGDIKKKNFYVNNEKLELIKLLFDEIDINPEDLKDFIEDKENIELTENLVTFDGKEHDIYWYIDAESSKEGFIDVNTKEVYTLEYNRLEYLKAIMSLNGILDELVDEYEVTDEELEEIEKAI